MPERLQYSTVNKWFQQVTWSTLYFLIFRSYYIQTWLLLHFLILSRLLLVKNNFTLRLFLHRNSIKQSNKLIGGVSYATLKFWPGVNIFLVKILKLPNLPINKYFSLGNSCGMPREYNQKVNNNNKLLAETII